MRKIIITLTMLVVLFSFVGCQKTGKAYLQPGEVMSVERTVSGNDVTLGIAYDSGLIDANEIIIVADKLPDGVTFVSANPTADISSGQVVVWLFAKNPPQTLGSMTIDKGIPSTITYTTTGTAVAGSTFRGKWGLKIANIEGLFIGDEGGPICISDADCQTGYGCIGGTCVPGGSDYDLNNDGRVDLIDLTATLDMWGQTRNGMVIDLVFLTNLLDSWT